METRCPQDGLFSLNFEFLEFPRVLMSLYVKTEKCFIFYDIAREYIITSTEERREIYRVDYSYINTALSQ